MNSDSIAGRWHEWKGDLKARWGRITDDEWTEASGDRERISGLLQQRYGLTREQADDELTAFAASRRSGPGDARMADGGARIEGNVEDNGVRAQPGDVLGLDTDGETTELGDTAEDEDKRRVASARAATAAERD